MGQARARRVDAAPGQDAVALQCMQEAVRGTSFPVEEGGSAVDSKRGARGASKFVAYWNWSVPLELAVKNGKTGGCDGYGALPKCYACGQDFRCIKVCVGVDQKGCEAGGGVCTEDYEFPCASGRYGTGRGGVIIY